MSDNTDPELQKKIREKIKYIRAHRKAVMDVAKELTGSVPGYLRHHDMDKIHLLRQGIDPEEVSKIHRAHSSHHPYSDAETPNYDEMIFDWESARRTKPDKPLNAYDTMMKYYPDLKDTLLPRMKELGLVKDSASRDSVFADAAEYYTPKSPNGRDIEHVKGVLRNAFDYVKTAEMSRDRIQAQYARHPQSSLDVLAKRLAKNKWGVRDVVREDDAHREEFGATGEDKEYLDRYIIARIAEQYDRRAKCKQAVLRTLWEKEHNGESFDAALPARMARFRQYEGTPFGVYANELEQRKWDNQPDQMPEGVWEKYLKS